MPRQDLTDQQWELLSGYVLYDLSPEETALVEQWIAADPAISQEIERLQQALEFAYTPETVEPAAALRASTMAAYQTQLAKQSPQRDAQGARQRSPQPLPQKRPVTQGRWLKPLSAMAALLIAGLGITNYYLWRSLQTALPPRPPVQSGREPQRTINVTLTPPPDAPSQSSATVALDLVRLRGTITPQLPPLPEGKVYVLWTVLAADAPFTTDDKNAILTHKFTGTAEEMVLLPPVYQDIRWVRELAVTIEDAAAPQRHAADPVLMMAL